MKRRSTCRGSGHRQLLLIRGSL